MAETLFLNTMKTKGSFCHCKTGAVQFQILTWITLKNCSPFNTLCFACLAVKCIILVTGVLCDTSRSITTALKIALSPNSFNGVAFRTLISFSNL